MADEQGSYRDPGSNLAAALMGLSSGLKQGMQMREEKKRYQEERDLKVAELEYKRDSELQTQRTKLTQDLRKERESSKFTQDTLAASGFYKIGLNAASDKVGDRTLLTSYINVINPNANLKPGDWSSIQGNENYDEAARDWASKLSGKKDGQFSDVERAALKRDLHNAYLTKTTAQSNYDNFIKEQAINSGIDPKDVIAPIIFEIPKESQVENRYRSPIQTEEQTQRNLKGAASTFAEKVSTGFSSIVQGLGQGAAGTELTNKSQISEALNEKYKAAKASGDTKTAKEMIERMRKFDAGDINGAARGLTLENKKPVFDIPFSK